MTNYGPINLELDFDKAPKSAANFLHYTKQNFYDGTSFHRVINDFMIQGGCPLGTGTGDPGYSFSDELHKDLKHDGMLNHYKTDPP
jgi:peptidyl-prolyl cis-trans isomerase B (cyclophilin B)